MTQQIQLGADSVVLITGGQRKEAMVRTAEVKRSFGWS